MKEGSPITLDEFFEHLKQSVRKPGKPDKNETQFFMKKDLYGRPSVYFQDHEGEIQQILYFERDESGRFRVKLICLEYADESTKEQFSLTPDDDYVFNSVFGGKPWL
jgi:hypothetical protein